MRSLRWVLRPLRSKLRRSGRYVSGTGLATVVGCCAVIWCRKMSEKIPIHIYVITADCSQLRPIAEVVKLISLGVRTCTKGLVDTRSPPRSTAEVVKLISLAALACGHIGTLSGHVTYALIGDMSEKS